MYFLLSLSFLIKFERSEDFEENEEMRTTYARALFGDAAATLDDVRESVTTLGDVERIAQRVFGREHPLTKEVEREMQHARAALRVRETQPLGK